MISISDKNPKGFPGLQTGGNVGCFCWIFSWSILGCSPTTLIGLDMGVNADISIEKLSIMIKYSIILMEIKQRLVNVIEKFTIMIWEHYHY